MEKIRICTMTKEEQLIKVIRDTFQNSCYDILEEDSQELSSLIIEAPSVTDFVVLKSTLADLLSKYILTFHEHRFIYRELNRKYFYLSAKEKMRIYQLSLKKAVAEEGSKLLHRFWAKEREQIIRQAVSDYLDTSEELVFDGFCNFRLQAYMREIDDLVNKAVDDFVMEKEYSEFIELLRFFVEAQEPKVNEVHVVIEENGKYMLLDERFSEIVDECMTDYKVEFINGLINEDDLLISSLVTLAPLSLTVHQSERMKNKELLSTLKKVFNESFFECGHCPLCEVGNVCERILME